MFQESLVDYIYQIHDPFADALCCSIILDDCTVQCHDERKKIRNFITTK
jgi:hypothetical protein